jgi:hypothetical protein
MRHTASAAFQAGPRERVGVVDRCCEQALRAKWLILPRDKRESVPHGIRMGSCRSEKWRRPSIPPERTEANEILGKKLVHSRIWRAPAHNRRIARVRSSCKSSSKRGALLRNAAWTGGAGPLVRARCASLEVRKRIACRKSSSGGCLGKIVSGTLGHPPCPKGRTESAGPPRGSYYVAKPKRGFFFRAATVGEQLRSDTGTAP